MADLIVREATIRGHEGTIDLAVTAERITAIEPRLDERAPEEIQALGRLLVPTFIDPHVHLDKALISEVVRENRTGTLTEAIEIIWDKKRTYTEEDIIERATRVVGWAVQNGTTILRTHVDVDTVGGLLPLRAVLKAREALRDIADIQIVAFPQEGILQDPGAEDLMRQAMAKGADVVGGMPYNERIPADWAKHIDIAFAIAKAFHADIDMHVDETDDPQARSLAILAAKTIEEGYQGRVTAGHTCALAAYDDPYAARVISLVKGANMNMVVNPATNLMLQGRYDKEPRRRGITRAKELLGAGVNVLCGQDCLKDTFYPTFGQADLLEVGLILAHAAQMSLPHEVDTILDIITTHAAKALHIPDYGLHVGATASFNLLDAPNAQEAFRTRRPRPLVVRRGRIVARSTIEQTLYRLTGQGGAHV